MGRHKRFFKHFRFFQSVLISPCLQLFVFDYFKPISIFTLFPPSYTDVNTPTPLYENWIIQLRMIEAVTNELLIFINLLSSLQVLYQLCQSPMFYLYV